MLHLFFPDIVNSAIIVGNEDSEENSAIIVGNEDSEESKLCSPKHNFLLYNQYRKKNSAIIVGNEDSEESKLCSPEHNFLLYNQYRKKNSAIIVGNEDSEESKLCSPEHNFLLYNQYRKKSTLDGPHGLATTLAGPWGGGVWCGRDLPLPPLPHSLALLTHSEKSQSRALVYCKNVQIENKL
ncbi:hypothetical protein BY996DRAFT_6425031 [Phakopsora pachyrhizi]|nr:hypothetical protein BY996DRAFT_6425031 [Phakopsora pachyrhizi]